MAESESESESGAVHQYLGFSVAGEEYALQIHEVREIVQYATVTRIPSMPASIRGVTNLRGRVVPVVDLAVRLGLPEASLTRRTCIVMVEAGLDGDASVVGLLVDSVSQVLDLPHDQILPPPAFGTRSRVDYVRGMGQLGARFVPLLKLERLLDEEELLAAGHAAREEDSGAAAPESSPPQAEGAAAAASR